MARADSLSSRRRGVRDPRLLIGLALVMASVAGVVGLVAAIDSRSVVYAASGALTPGDTVAASDLIEKSVSLDGADGLYVRRGDIPEEGLVVVAPVRKGELLPRASLGEKASVDATTIVIAPASAVSSSVTPATEVDVWASPFDPATRTYGAPAVIVPGALVVEVLDEKGLVTSSSGAHIEVQVPREAVARILQAQAAGDALAVVPAGLPLD